MSLPFTSSVNRLPVRGSSSICFLSLFLASLLRQASLSRSAAAAASASDIVEPGMGLVERGDGAVLRA